jgi:hemoglobin/transferrin/lactoferrin receptor protein
LIATVPPVCQAEAENQSTEQESIGSFVVVGETTNTEITPQELEFQQANDLADVFRHIPSVSVGGSLGIAQKVYIRGLEDTLLNITVDGAPQTGTLFHHIGRVSIEPELLKTVEVQAGAGEATSGAGVIGGAIRFKTKSADDLLAPDQKYGALIKGGYFSNDGYKGSVSLFGKLNDDWGLLASYVDVNRDNMEDGDDNELYGTAADQSLGFAKVNGALSENQHLTVSFEQREESGEFGQRPNWPALESDPRFPIDGERQTFVLNHVYQPSDLINLETTVYHTKSEIIQNVHTFRSGPGWGEYGATMKSVGFDLRNTSWIGQHTLTYGADLRKDTVESEYLDKSVVADWAWDPNVDKFTEEGQVTGFYLQDHWQAMEALLLSFGVRYDDYELEQVTYDDETDSSGFSPNLGLKYDVNDQVQITLGHARAMRGKEVGDGFTLSTEPGVITLYPDLEPEKVRNSELGIEYFGDQLGLKASVYQSTIEDVILDQLGQGTYYENIGELETEGFELQAAYQWEKLRLSASYSYNDVQLNGHAVEGYEQIGLANSRGDTWNLQASYDLTPQLEIGWYYTYVEDLNDIEVLHRGVELGWIEETQTVDKPGYSVHDIYMTWSPLSDDSLSVSLAVQNLFNEHYRDHSSVADYGDIPGWESVAGLYEAGRDIRLGVNYRF